MSCSVRRDWRPSRKHAYALPAASASGNQRNRLCWRSEDSDIMSEASQEEMKFHRVPLGYRDSCAHLLIPLNQCRLRELYLPWKCEEERHAYERCQYADFKDRVKAFREAEKAQRENLSTE